MFGSELGRMTYQTMATATWRASFSKPCCHLDNYSIFFWLLWFDFCLCQTGVLYLMAFIFATGIRSCMLAVSYLLKENPHLENPRAHLLLLHCPTGLEFIKTSYFVFILWENLLEWPNMPPKYRDTFMSYINIFFIFMKTEISWLIINVTDMIF